MVAYKPRTVHGPGGVRLVATPAGPVVYLGGNAAPYLAALQNGEVGDRTLTDEQVAWLDSQYAEIE